MKVALAILILATNVFCHRGGWNDFLKRHGHGGRNTPHGMMPLPPFLQTARREAQREFFEILGDMELTIAQQKEEVQKWAEKYGFSEKLQDFNEKMEKMNSEAKENATNLIAELPAAMEKGSALMANKNQTILELHSSVKTLYAENPKLYRVLMFIIGQFMPSHDLQGGKWGPKRASGHHSHANMNGFHEFQPHFVNENERKPHQWSKDGGFRRSVAFML
ncbi:hypothetical protein RB195_009204 [Necator americanus]|uniref:SXP/RAL-2 family protein Ani s 5-like cation-binding domain-containing protein n=1 Tax=Necator americanus TaxID=51031 RepID=A0ABR1CU62_NECAM